MYIFFCICGTSPSIVSIISTCRGRSFCIMSKLHFSRASGSTVWLVYATVLQMMWISENQYMIEWKTDEEIKLVNWNWRSNTTHQHQATIPFSDTPSVHKYNLFWIFHHEPHTNLNEWTNPQKCVYIHLQKSWNIL